MRGRCEPNEILGNSLRKCKSMLKRVKYVRFEMKSVDRE